MKRKLSTKDVLEDVSFNGIRAVVDTTVFLFRIRQMPNSVINLVSNSSGLFFGNTGHSLARYDVVPYPALAKLDERMKSLFWRPQEIDMSQERASFAKMTDADKHVFTSNLQRQILLDTIQGRSPSLAFLPHCCDPSLENCLLTWSFFESIHSESYTHIIRAIYPNPSAVFDQIPSIGEISECSQSIAKAYDSLIESPDPQTLYLALVAANALEALRFFVSFACTFSFAERGLVEGSAKAVRFIARDEAVHLALVQNIIKLLAKESETWNQVINDNRPAAIALFEEAAEQEIAWINYLFKEGSIIGLNPKILTQYVEYLLPRRKYAAGLTTHRSTTEHPIPWVERWFNSDNVQVAPQEVEVASYLTGMVVNDLGDSEFEI